MLCSENPPFSACFGEVQPERKHWIAMYVPAFDCCVSNNCISVGNRVRNILDKSLPDEATIFTVSADNNFTAQKVRLRRINAQQHCLTV